MRKPTSTAESSRHPSYHSEPSLEPESFCSPTFGKSFHFDPLSSGSHSSSLKSAQRTGFVLDELQSMRSEGTTSTSCKSLANQTCNGSLSQTQLSATPLPSCQYSWPSNRKPRGMHIWCQHESPHQSVMTICGLPPGMREAAAPVTQLPVHEEEPGLGDSGIQSTPGSGMPS